MGYNREEPGNESLTQEQQKNRPVEEEEKEGNRWLETMERVSESIPSGTKVIHICDREGDVYELFIKAVANGRLFLIRVIQNRLTAGAGKYWTGYGKRR
jgi:hypothetical protein